MTIYQQTSEKENALNTRRVHTDLDKSKEGDYRCGLNMRDDEIVENNDSWPTDHDDEENLHNDAAPMESKAKFAAQVVLYRRNNNRHGKASNRVIGRTIQADSQPYNNISQSAPSPSSSPSHYSRRTSTQRSFVAKRRKIIIYTAIGLVLFGYFFETMQLIKRMSSEGDSQQEIVIDLPDAVNLHNKSNSINIDSITESHFIPSAVSHHDIIPNKEEWDRVKAITNSRAEQRRKRTRPPNLLTKTEESVHSVPVTISGVKTDAPQMTLDLPVHRSLNESIDKSYLATSNKNIRSNTQQSTAPTICGIHADLASKNDSSNYPSSAYIGPQSRVIVTGALSQLGMEIILQLYSECGTEYILGIDSVLPNTRHDRMAALERYRFLQHHVPAFQKLQVPIFGIAPHPKLGDEIRMDSIGKEFDIIDRFNPTHIVHLTGLEEGRGEYNKFGDTDDVSAYTTGGHSSMMRRYQNLVSMDQILASIARFKRNHGNKTQPQLVYVSSTEVEDQSGVTFVGGMEENLGKASVYGSCSLLKEVLASYYHRHHGVESVGIRLSTMYGPFARPGSLINDLAERTLHFVKQLEISAAGENADKYALETILKRREGAETGALEQITYARDLAQAFVAAMQYKGDRTNGPALLNLGSKDTISMKEIGRWMSDYLPTLTKTIEANQLAKETLEASTATGLVATFHGLNSPENGMKRNLDLLGWSPTTETQDGLRSMLAWQIMKAYPFAPPNAVSTIKEFLDTSQFPYVGLSSTLPCASGCGWHGKCASSVWDAVIEEARAATAKCKYVIYTVDLSSDLVELKEKPSKSKEKKDFCNIAFISSSSVLAKQSKDSQWTIITIDGNEPTMTEAERSLAKLSPTMLFSDKVSHAFYADNRKLKVSIDDVVAAIQSMSMNSIKEKTRDAKRKLWLLPRSKRHSVMFTSRMTTPKGHDINSASAHARFVMSNFGVKMTQQIQKQIQFYQQASHLVRNNLLRSTNYANKVIENTFPFEYIRSNWLLHDLKSDEGHQLRCEVYEEHATWGNQHMEDFSMAFVLAKRTVMMELGQEVETPDSPGDWYPLFVPKKTKDMVNVFEGPEYLEYLDPSRKAVAKNHKGSEIFISFLSHESTSKGDK